MAVTDLRADTVARAAAGKYAGATRGRFARRGERRRLGRRRRFSMGITTWSLLSAVLLLGGAGALFVTSYEDASTEALRDAARTTHDDWVANGHSLLDEQTAAAAEGLKDLYISGNDLPIGSPQLIETLLTTLLSNRNDLLRYQLVATSTAENGYSSVGYSGAAAQIGVASAADGKMMWRPVQGGTGVTLPGFVPTERDWYRQAVVEPDRLQVIGPSLGLDNKQHFTLAIAEPGSHQVWTVSFPTETIARLVEIAWPPDRNHSTGFFLVDEDGALDMQWSSTRVQLDDMRATVSELRNRDTYTTIVDTDSGPRYVTVGRVFDDNDSAVWVTSSAAEAAAEVDTSRMLLIGGALALAAVVAVGAGGAALSRTLRKTREYVTGAASHGALGEPPASWVTEVDHLAEAARDTIDDQLAGADALRADGHRLEQLHQRTTEFYDEHRRRLATELHDGPLQDVLAAVLLTEAGDAASVEHLHRARDGMRELTAKLLGDESGPSGFVDRLVEIADEAGLEDRFEVTVTAPERVVLPRNVANALVRATRELLVNARKHSGSPVAEVTVAVTDDTVQVTVADRGVGFSAADLSGGHRRDGGGFGLFSIEVEVNQLDGTITRGVNPHGGATVTVAVPLDPHRR